MSVGCETHTARILDRDGGTVCAVDQLVEVRWQRLLNEVSLAQAVVIPSGDCCSCLAGVRQWRHRLAIWRAGELVWDGPVVLPVWTADGMEITALDIGAWLDVRLPHRDMTFDADLNRIARALIADAFQPDDPGHQVQIVAPAGVTGHREYEQDVGQTGDHLRDLARTGMDWTVIGSRILLLPDWWCQRVGSLTDADFPDGLQVVGDGRAVATRWVVHGDDDVQGQAGGVDPYYGLIEREADEPSISDEQSADAAARSLLGASLPAPLLVQTQQATLAPDAAIELGQLVPGWCVDVATTVTCRSVTAPLKIIGVEVREDSDGETVSVALSPPGDR